MDVPRYKLYFFNLPASREDFGKVGEIVKLAPALSGQPGGCIVRAWQGYSNEHCAQDLIVDADSVKGFLEWLEIEPKTSEDPKKTVVCSLCGLTFASDAIGRPLPHGCR